VVEAVVEGVCAVSGSPARARRRPRDPGSCLRRFHRLRGESDAYWPMLRPRSIGFTA